MSQLVGGGAAIAATAALVWQSLRNNFIGEIANVLQWIGYHKPGGGWRIFAIVLALVNLKNLPGVWHVRLLICFVYS